MHSDARHARVPWKARSLLLRMPRTCATAPPNSHSSRHKQQEHRQTSAQTTMRFRCLQEVITAQQASRSFFELTSQTTWASKFAACLRQLFSQCVQRCCIVLALLPHVSFLVHTKHGRGSLLNMVLPCLILMTAHVTKHANQTIPCKFKPEIKHRQSLPS